VPLHWVQRLKAYVTQKGSEEEQYWLTSLARQIHLERPEAPSSPGVRMSILGRSTMGSGEVEKGPEVDREQLVRLHPPHLTASGGPAPGVHMEVERQGPAVFDPAPPEGDEDDVASDLILVGVVPSGTGQKGAVGVVRVLGVCWSSGRVDIGVETAPVMGRWVGSSVSRVSRSS
jgi:nucleoporin NUP82